MSTSQVSRWQRLDKAAFGVIYGAIMVLSILMAAMFLFAGLTKLMGAEIGTRMTVVGLPERGLALISPIAIDDALATALAALGEVRALQARLLEYARDAGLQGFQEQDPSPAPAQKANGRAGG